MRDTLLAIWRARKLVVAIVALALCGAAAALALMERQYAASAVVQLDFGRRDAGFGVEQAPIVSLDAGSLIQSEVRIIRSRLLARRVVERLGLADNPEYGDSPPGVARQFAKLREVVVGAVELVRGEATPAPAPETSPAEAMPEEEVRAVRAAARVMKDVSVGTDQKTYLITITGTARDPVRAAEIANAVAEEYVRHRTETNVAAADRTISWLGGQMRQADEALRNAEGELARFRARTGLLEPSRSGGLGGGETVEQQQLRELTSQLTAATAMRSSEERRLARIKEMLDSGSLPSTTDLQGSPLIASLLDREAMARRDLGALLTRLGPRHPNVLEAQAGIERLRAQTDAEVRRAVAAAAAEVRAARRAEDELTQRVAAQHRGMIAVKETEAELLNRLAQVQTARERVAILSRSGAQAAAARDLRGTNATVVIPAEPDRAPASPKPLVVVLVTLAGGLGVGVAAAALAERRDQGFRTSEEVRSRLGVRCLAMVPELPPRARRGAEIRGQAVFDEAIHAIAAGADLFGGARECRVVLVTSSLAGEGKSTLCDALARTLTKTGQRVLLINSPAARGEPEEAPAVLSAPAAGEAGAAAEGPAAASAAGRPLVVLERKRPFVLTAGVFYPGGFGPLLQQMRKHFDVILIEGAPVMLLADSLVLARLADTVIHVARWSGTKRRIVDAAVRRLQDHSVPVDGVVLSRVNLRRHARLRFLDECFFYIREKRFYQHLDRSAPQHAQRCSPK